MNKNKVDDRISNIDNHDRKEILEEGQKKVTEENQFNPYYCPVCPTKMLISPMVVDSHINGKSHQKMLIMQKSGKYKSNNIASSAKSSKSAEDKRGIEQELSKAVEEVNSTEGMEGKMTEIAEMKMKSTQSY